MQEFSLGLEHSACAKSALQESPCATGMVSAKKDESLHRDLIVTLPGGLDVLWPLKKPIMLKPRVGSRLNRQEFHNSI